MSYSAEEDTSESSDSSHESSLHSLLNRPVETRAQANARQNSTSSGSATASMNSFVNSTGPFTTPPVIQVGIPVTTNTTTNTTNSSGPSGSSTPAPTPVNFPTMTMEQMTLLFDKILGGQKSQTTPQRSSDYESLPTPSVKQVPHSEYQQTTTAQSKSFSDLKFGNNVTTNRETLKSVKILLAETGLHSLVDGSRRKPIHSTDNVFGYTPDSVRKIGFEITLVPKDDLFKYAHDCKRLFSIMNQITARDLHYLVNQSLIDRDGVAWFTAIVEHVHGTTNADIRKAKHALENLKIYDTKTVKENIALLQESFLHLNNAQSVPLTEDEKTYYLHEKFCLDGRISV